MTVGVPNETRTRYLPHTSLNHHRYTNQPDRQGQVMSKDNQRRDFIVVKAEPDDKRPGIYVFVATDPVALSTWCVQVLRSPKEAFVAAMQSWRERCEKCVCLQGDYVEK